MLSAVVLLATGYVWSVYRALDGGIAGSDVVGAHPAADGATDILLVGLDSRTDGHGNPLPQPVLDELSAGSDTGTLNTDTLILVRVPNDPNGQTTAVSIPRDSYVDIPGYGKHKINSAYERAMTDTRNRLAAAGVRDPDLTAQAQQAGRRLLISTVEQLTGVSVDHYAEINLVGFAEITAAVGGVPVCLNAPVRDDYSGADLPAGPQTLQGPPALAFVRQRHGLPRGDLDRIVRQQAFMASLAHEVLAAHTLADPSRLATLVQAVDRYVVLDQGWDLLGFASQAQGLSAGNISFRTIPTGSLALPTPSDGVAVQVDPSAVRAFVSALSGGNQDATAEGAPASGPAISSALPRGTTVDVLNGTGRAGLAASVQAFLGQHGATAGTIGSTPRTARSTIHTGRTQLSAARTLSQLLGGTPVVLDDAPLAGHLRLVLGSDYAGPAAPSVAPTATPDAASGATPDTAGGAAADMVGAGTAGTGGAAPTSTDAEAPPITAGGVPCVN